MNLLPYPLLRPLLFAVDPEHIHDLTIKALSATQRTPLACAYGQRRIDDPVTLAGLRFPNRIGLAAGLDKNADCIDGLAAFGFGFIEVGTVTPLAQPGNPAPRLFRLPQAGALINRFGFNNDGVEVFVANVQRARFRENGGILGLNIGKNKVTPIEQATEDYVKTLDAVYPHADYVAVNVSSPNTAQLRSLQTDTAFDHLLAVLDERRDQLAQTHQRHVPLFVKIAPDLAPEQVNTIADALTRHGIDGVIAVNTTVSRTGVEDLPHATETGGLSGAPLKEVSNRVIRALRTALGRNYPIIGVGGVMSATDAVEKIDAGADLVQIYTGFIYHGPALIKEAASALRAHGQRGLTVG